MFFKKKSEIEKELVKYEKAFRGQGLDVKGPVGMSLNVIYSGFHQKYQGVAAFLADPREKQDAYLEKLMGMSDAAQSKGHHHMIVAAHIFALYLVSAQQQDMAAHTKAREVMTDLSKAGDMIAG